MTGRKVRQRLERRPTIFVASTMPFSDEWILELLRSPVTVVCNHEDVRRSSASLLEFLGANHKSSAQTVPQGLVPQIKQIWATIASSPFVVLTHECCWPMLDLSVAMRRPHGRRVEMAHLNAMHKMTFAEIVRSGSTTAAEGTGRLRALIRVLARIGAWPFFMLHVAPGARGNWIAWAPRPWLKRKLRPLQDHRAIAEVGARSAGRVREPRADQRRTMLAVVGRGTQDEETLRSTYATAITQAAALGYAVHIKDHIRPQSRIDIAKSLSEETSKAVSFLDPTIPAEALISVGSPDVVLGIDSAALGLGQGCRVSLLDLVDMPDSRRSELRQYLDGLINGKTITYVETWGELKRLLCE
jgi:hypothetical protein